MAKTLVVQSVARPTPRPIDQHLADEAWRDYQATIWNARLDARLHCTYFADVRRVLGSIRFALELVVTLGSAGAVATLLAGAHASVTTVVTVIVAVCAAVLQIASIADRTRNAAELVEAWNARARFWDDAWILVRSGHYLGPVSELFEHEENLAKIEEELGFPNWAWWQRRIQARIAATDEVVLASVRAVG